VRRKTQEESKKPKEKMIIAHLPSGYLMAVALLRRIRRVKPSAVIAAGVAGAGAPDLDMFYFHLVDHGKVHHHQYLTHWPILWIGLLAASALWFKSKPSRAGVLLQVFALGGVLHLMLDTLVGEIPTRSLP
jgi:LexA-binding, inner membrane-associated putative hydrolase